MQESGGSFSEQVINRKPAFTSLFRQFVGMLFKDCKVAEQLPAILSELWFNLEFQKSLQTTYECLADHASRQCMVRLLAFRALGGKHVNVLPEIQDYEAELASLVTEHLRTPNVTEAVISGRTYQLGLFDTTDLGFGFQLLSIPQGLHALCKVEQYAYHTDTIHITAAPEDIVIDAGGGWGDTAVYFADLVGPRGKVYTLEFIEDNLRIIQQNLAVNPGFDQRVQLVRHGLWDTSDCLINFSENGSASRLLEGAPSDTAGESIITITIDDLLEKHQLDRVDFIKMDIEGAEERALLGAAKTLRRHAPKLAISAYHRTDDLARLPALIKTLNPAYSLYLKHATPVRQETVLFAIAK